jgi:hypothetical protein
VKLSAGNILTGKWYELLKRILPKPVYNGLLTKPVRPKKGLKLLKNCLGKKIVSK